MSKIGPWTMTELHRAAKLWKEGFKIHEIAAQLGRNFYSLKKQTTYRRDMFPRRKQVHGDLSGADTIKFAITPYLHKLIREEAKTRGISINMVIRETLRDRFVRKLWKPQESTSTEKVPYFNGSRGG